MPKCIFLQFTRLVNFYFLFTAIIICIEAISSLDPSTAIGPLSIVLLVSLVREFIDEVVITNIYTWVIETAEE